jgi:hypothetical protein
MAFLGVDEERLVDDLMAKLVPALNQVLDERQIHVRIPALNIDALIDFPKKGPQ